MGTSSVHLYHIIQGLMDITEALSLDAFDAHDLVLHDKLERQFLGYEELLSWLDKHI